MVAIVAIVAIAVGIATLLRRTIICLRSVKVSIGVRGGRALNLTGCSLAGVDVHIHHDIQILGILAYIVVRPGYSYVFPEGVEEDHLGSRSHSRSSVADLC